jgi:hypothetical protein
MGTEASLALVSQRCVPKRLRENGFNFEISNFAPGANEHFSKPVSTFVILSEAKDLTLELRIPNVYRVIQSPWARSLTAFAVPDDSALDTRTT